MLTKESLKKEFSKDWKKYYQVEVFKTEGFGRKICSKCRRAFWTVNQDRAVCGDSPCQNYEFIGKQVTAKKYDYIEMWKAFERFFVKNGHTSILRYPVIDRWRQDLYFTIASIQDFQRLDNGNMAFVYPANPLIVPQVSLRFGDIQNVGVTGRHLTGFVMSGQHAFNYPKEKGSYFKDRCIELNFNFVNKVLGVRKEDIVYHEDFWAMPDFSAFGPSIETFSHGLEFVNSVFMEFQSDDQKSFRPLDMKVIDVGWGHERLVWLSNGTETKYDCVFGPVTEHLKKTSGVKIDPKIFSKYSKLAGSLNIDEKIDVGKIRGKIADSIGISVNDLVDQIEPLTAIYAIADHTRTLLFAIADGGIPSNIGGGYNLRVILRRSLAFLKQHNFNFNLMDIAERHAKFLKPMFPELAEGLESMEKILEVEEEKYAKTLSESRRVVESILKTKKEFDAPTLKKLYESNGIAPETVKEVGKENKIEIKIPQDFYGSISKEHAIEKPKEKKIKLDLTGLPDTELLFYKDPDKKVFEGKILRVLQPEDKNYKWIVLDQTLFYPESGGQEWDTGNLGGSEVFDVQKFGHIVAHKIADSKFKEGQKVKGEIHWDRRTQLMHHHSAIHIINGAAKIVLGKHAWQAGTHKSVEKAHIDVSHYKGLTEEEVKKIEQLANQVVRKNIKTKSSFVPRLEAEKKFGLGIYQGGHIPEKNLRIMEIPGHDTEACSGTHVHETGGIGKIIIVGTEKIQDGVVRITIKAGKAAERYLDENMEYAKGIADVLNKSGFVEIGGLKTNKESATKDLQEAAKNFGVPLNQVKGTFEKFINEIKGLEKQKTAKPEIVETIWQASGFIFELWKSERKEADKSKEQASKGIVASLINSIRGEKISRIEDLGRKELILAASEVLKIKPDTTIILANKEGDIIVMSRKEDCVKLIKEIAKKAGGYGGGRPDFAQGKVDPGKLKDLQH